MAVKKDQLHSNELKLIARHVDTETMKMIAIKYLGMNQGDLADIEGKFNSDAAVQCLERWRSINQGETKNIRELLYGKLVKASDQGLIPHKTFAFLHDRSSSFDASTSEYSTVKSALTNNLSYKISNPEKIGVAVIINNLGTDYPETKQEMASMNKMLKSMKFETFIYEGCDDMEMRMIRKWLRKEETHSGMSMFALCILTHGTEDGWLRPVHDAGHGWYLPDIIGTISDVKELSGKPKLFFINACRGNGELTGLEITKTAEKMWTNLQVLQVQFDIITSQDQDVFLGYSSQEGFFNILRQCLQDYHKSMPLDQIYTKATRKAAVNMEMAKKTNYYFPHKMSTLHSLVFLTSQPRTKGNYLKEAMQRQGEELFNLQQKITHIHQKQNKLKTSQSVIDDKKGNFCSNMLFPVALIILSAGVLQVAFDDIKMMPKLILTGCMIGLLGHLCLVVLIPWYLLDSYSNKAR